MINKDTWIFDIKRFKYAPYEIRLYIKNLIIQDIKISIDNNGYNDPITNDLINDSLNLIDILGF